MMDGQEMCVIKSVMMEPMDINVSTAVVVTVLITLHVTNRPDNVTRDAARDIQTLTAEKNVHLDNLDWSAENVVADIV